MNATENYQRRTLNELTDSDIEKAREIVKKHNDIVCPDGKFCATGRSGYWMIDTTGKNQVYYTLYRYNNMIPKGSPVDPLRYCKNLSVNILEAVTKMATGKGLPIILNENDNFNPADYQPTLITFGKYKNQLLDDVYAKDSGYVIWIANKFEARNKAGRKLVEHAQLLREAHFQMITEQNQETCTSEFQGTQGERAEHTLTIYSAYRGERTVFGVTEMDESTKYKATDSDGNLYLFWTKLKFEKDQTVEVIGTVADHREILGKKFTRINRVKLCK